MLTLRALLLAATASLLFAGCEATETTNEADGSNADGKKQTARIGDSITVEGTDTKMKVTVLRVIDPLVGGEFDTPNRGRRYVGVEIRLKNVGEGPYDDAPSNGAELIMGNDTQAEWTILSGGDCSSDFGSSATIGPGSVQQGCLPFEAKAGLRPKTFQFALDSGFGPQAGEWRLGGRAR